MPVVQGKSKRFWRNCGFPFWFPEEVFSAMLCLQPMVLRVHAALMLCLTLSFSALAQHAYRQLREFGFVERSAAQPLTALVEGPGDWLYGTSQGGNGGVIFRVKKDGSGFSVIFDFNGTNGLPSDGPLLLGSDGALYGTTLLAESEGTSAKLYRIQPDGTGFTPMTLIADPFTISGVIEGQDGRLYGTTLGGGAYGLGTIFAVSKNGTGFTVLHHFEGGATDGQFPTVELLEGSDGALYTVTSRGGSGDGGTVCRINKSGAGFALLHHFPASGTNDGRLPNTRLVEGIGGNLYGTTSAGGIGGEDEFFNGYGVVFRVSNDGDVYSIVRRFEDAVHDGQKPRNILVGADGLLYGTSQNAAYAHNVDGVFRMDPDGANFSFVYSWVTADNQTIQLNALIKSADGNFYGTSRAGSASQVGQAFKLRPNGTQYQSLHDFSLVGGDGSLPGTLIGDTDGTLYGATLGGGFGDSGTIYKLETSGAYTILHQFAAQSGFPLSLLAASDGLLYGTAQEGKQIFRLGKDGLGYTVLTNLTDPLLGNLIEGSDFLFYGVTDSSIFSLNSDGSSLQEVHTFTNAVTPSGIMEGSDGKLYGSALRGGSNNQGMVFRLNKDGGQYQVIYSFVAPTGTLVFPNPLLEAGDGYLYGTTYRAGGASEGTIYRLSKTGAYEFIHAFASGRGNPIGRLAEGPGGWLYGVSQESGNFLGGHLFRFRIGGPSPIYILHHFGEGSLGRDPAVGVTLDPAGGIYGTTQYGGFGEGFGTIFRVDVRPILSARRNDGNLEISWPHNGDNYNLEFTPSLALPWAYYSGGFTNTGERVTATVPLQTDRLFRLQKTP